MILRSMFEDGVGVNGHRPLRGGANRDGRPGRAFRLSLLAVLAALLVPVLGPGAEPSTSIQLEPFAFVQMCDPQIGFTDYAADLGRFEQGVKRINELKPDFVVVCGDLVNTASEKSFADFKAARARFTVPCHSVPGNHDVGNQPTAATLEQYRKWIGKDYYSFEHKGRAFVCVNAQLWKTAVPGESDKHNAWVRQTLEAAAEKKQPVFVISHYLLFEKEADEPEAYFNLPVEKRKELLELFERCGVVALLAGHTHKTSSQAHRGIQMVTAETTSRNFDQRPFGFRLWRVGDTRPYEHEFVPLAEK